MKHVSEPAEPKGESSCCCITVLSWLTSFVFVSRRDQTCINCITFSKFVPLGVKGAARGTAVCCYCEVDAVHTLPYSHSYIHSVRAFFSFVCERTTTTMTVRQSPQSQHIYTLPVSRRSFVYKVTHTIVNSIRILPPCVCCRRNLPPSLPLLL